MGIVMHLHNLYHIYGYIRLTTAQELDNGLKSTTGSSMSGFLGSPRL